MNRDQIKAAYAHACPTKNKQKIAASAGQVFRFARSMKQGATVSARLLKSDYDAVPRGILPPTRI